MYKIQEIEGWEKPLMESLAQKHKELHDDWKLPFDQRKIFNGPQGRGYPTMGRGWSRTPWTVSIKGAFKDIARDYGLEYREEFLWDVSWFSQSLMPRMVCEIEWKNFKAVREDYRKLHATSSTYAMMVFDSQEKINTANDFETKVQALIKMAPVPDDRRFTFIYVSSTAAVDNTDPRVRAQSWVGNSRVYTFPEIKTVSV